MQLRGLRERAGTALCCIADRLTCECITGQAQDDCYKVKAHPCLLCVHLSIARPVIASALVNMSHPGRLEGKTAIITGAGLGLGEGITRKFIDEGANVLLFEINKENGQKVAESLPREKASLFTGDVTNQDHWFEALKACLDKFGGCDVCVNNAGVVHRSAVSLVCGLRHHPAMAC